MNHRFLFGFGLTCAFGALSVLFTWQPAPAAPKPKPAAPAQAQKPTEPTPAQAQQTQLPAGTVSSPWTKLCNAAQPGAVKVCMTGRDVRNDKGNTIISTTLIEPDGNPKKILRVTLPSPLQLQYGSRIVIDQNAPITAPIFTCLPNGLCLADFDGTPELVTMMKKGTTLGVQFVALNGSQVNLPTALADFAKANEGPATDPKVFEEQQKQLREKFSKQSQ